ncbi:probable 3,4-dihydroxy-2-butanone-4-phosphate synthase/ GTP cyclohydrolase II (plasmid) [Rhodococcus jostii RHA1]|uniref:3,4-dihydroxy-2-butanone-4-phosphate synthase n=1 Tax=Rhodococcus jostii (strain RHA1) TaxID=101510 RepID=Q0RUT2_RHOJR|nr:3,4-dihydroxy-2-butanone-4-phosphate synthase [Rhodococcus jostii]ABH00954.1 probable 3,4-dihydroxy-2-butanone-4-phosphate synthase/ GTP cyclohydrolase II [Rhodococcus jostii RHA1]
MTIELEAPPVRRSGRPAGTAAALSETVSRLALGETIVLCDGDRTMLAYSAATATVEQTAFVIRHTSGFLQIALPAPRCDRLLLPAAPTMFAGPPGVGYRQCIGVDAAYGVTTGISAADRTHTARTLADLRTPPGDLTRPGHLVVVAVDPGYRGRCPVPHLALRLADFGRNGLLFADLVDSTRPHDMADRNEAFLFADAHHLSIGMGDVWATYP